MYTAAKGECGGTQQRGSVLRADEACPTAKASPAAGRMVYTTVGDQTDKTAVHQRRMFKSAYTSLHACLHNLGSIPAHHVFVQPPTHQRRRIAGVAGTLSTANTPCYCSSEAGGKCRGAQCMLESCQHYIRCRSVLCTPCCDQPTMLAGLNAFACAARLTEA